jgi:hypothetical protein
MALAFGIKAHATSSSTISSLGITLTGTTGASGRLVCCAQWALVGTATAAGCSSALGAWTQRGSNPALPNANAAYITTFTIPFTSARTNEAITATITGTTSTFTVLDVWEVTGADTSASPWDSHSGLPVIGTTDPLSISTTNANDFVFGFFATAQTSPTAGSGWTLISGANFQCCEYQIVSATQSALSVSMTTGSGSAHTGIADALIAAVPVVCQPGSLAMMGVGCSLGWRAALLGGGAWWAAKTIERNGIITRRGLILPSRIGHNGGPPLSTE